ncbi:hypothetical protein FOQG_12620 [Fusarium oxysporum f. sp. raphani 54005]|uniref:Uncharacterized protein n=3 Tax=Fusarium oxysporum TaxID=5507 RepID=X0BMM3_FUSOX|nr:hypothetical protein FOVG_05421 [Fusarium oxysporum f. sp. pisi HDV247]EXK83101.1 hypothetical protein FOQG_12620 [Fusarium oxysporum f. sp. raphani 54005]
MHHAVELLLCVKAASDFAGVARGLTRWLHAVINHIIWQLPNVYAACETWSDLPELEYARSAGGYLRHHPFYAQEFASGLGEHIFSSNLQHLVILCNKYN